MNNLILFFIVGVFFLLTIVTYNSFVSLKNMVRDSFANMDVYLKKRWDLIPNLIAVVKSYAQHEKDVLTKISELRSVSYKQIPDSKKININQKLYSELNKIMLIVEAYPELKANENFLKLNTQLIEVEDEIANSRKYYNAVVREYNTKVETFPNSIIAKIFNFKTEKMFEINSIERENVRVDL